MLTLLSTCKPFAGEADAIQRAACANWASLGIDVIVFGRGEGVAEICREYGFCHVPDVTCDEKGFPLIEAMFHMAEDISVTDVLVYTNADILFHGLTDAVKIVAGESREFLIVGRRRDFTGAPPTDFSDGWQNSLVPRSRWHSISGVDYFVFTRGMWPSIGPYVAGYPAFDNFLVANAIARGKQVVDATGMILAFHPDHTRRYTSKSKQTRKNRQLLGKSYKPAAGFTNSGQWILAGGVLVRKDGAEIKTEVEVKAKAKVEAKVEVEAVPRRDEERAPPPFLTIVTRCCKRPVALVRAIESVQMQTDKDVEQVFIVDEGGKGLVWANRQLHEQRGRVSGEYVFVLDDDDMLATPGFVARLKDCVAQWDTPDVILLRHRQRAPKKVLLPPPHVWSLDWEMGERPERWAGSVYCFAVKRELWLANVWHFSHGQGVDWQTGGDWHFATALCSWPGLRFVRLDLVAGRSFQRGYGKQFEACKKGWFMKVAERFGIEDRGGGDWRLRYGAAS